MQAGSEGNRPTIVGFTQLTSGKSIDELSCQSCLSECRTSKLSTFDSLNLPPVFMAAIHQIASDEPAWPGERVGAQHNGSDKFPAPLPFKASCCWSAGCLGKIRESAPGRQALIG